MVYKLHTCSNIKTYAVGWLLVIDHQNLDSREFFPDISNSSQLNLSQKRGNADRMEGTESSQGS
jgi:hypothetical protein